MLLISPISDKNVKKELCALCGVTPRDGAFCYQAYDRETPQSPDGTFLGVSQFDIFDVGVLYDLANAEGVSDPEALFIMGRQTLNFIDLCGVHKAELSPDCALSEKLAHAIGFRRGDDGVWRMDMEGFFESPCSHDHK